MASGSFKQRLARVASNRNASRVFLSFSALLIAAVLFSIFARLNRASLFPAAENRFDVSEIFLAPMAVVCPEAAAALTVEAFEACLPKLSLADAGRTEALRPLRIPTLDEILAGNNPKLSFLLRQQGLTEALGALADKQPFVVGLRVPAKWFKENRLGQDPNVLVFAGLQDGRVCYDGRCPYVISRYEQNALPFPLVGKPGAGEGTRDVYVFAKDTAFAFGIGLFDGIFVTSYDHMYLTRKFYPLLAYGRMPLYAALFVGLFLMAFGFAFLWNEFTDYGAFCYMTGSFALVMMLGQSEFVRFEDLTWTHRAIGWGWLNVLVSSCLFAMATNRVRAGRLVATWLAAEAAVAAALPLLFRANDVQAAVTALNQVRLVAGLGLTFGAPTVVLAGALRCWRAYRRAMRSGPLSVQLDFRRRTVEQLLYGLCLAFIGAPILASAVNVMRGHLDELPFSPYAAVVLFAIFSIILYHSTTKLAKTHFRVDGQSEAMRLKGRLSMRQYLSWLAEPRQGVMIQVDLKNSSVAAASLKSRIHVLMQRLGDAMRVSHDALGFHWILAKRNGDEWLVILSNKNPALRDDLLEIVASTMTEVDRWRDLIRSMAPESSIHVNVYALTSYTLSSGNVQAPRGPGAWDVVDFASREANYLMKWAGKSGEEARLLVGAALPLMEPAITDHAEEVVTLSGRLSGAGNAPDGAVADVEAMKLAYAYVRYGEREGIAAASRGEAAASSTKSVS